MNIGQGHGKKGEFLGTGTSLEKAKIVIVPVPFDKTSTYQKGSDKGPSALIEASRNLELYDIDTDSEPYKKGIYTSAPIEAKSSKQMIEKTYEKVLHYLEHKKFVVTLGGEHTISYGAIKAHAEFYGPLTVLQFDAHADLFPLYENNRWSHASVMARVLELPKVSNIVSLGIRSLSAEELPNLKKTYHKLSKLKDPIYITFDLDAFDSSLMPSTGTPEPGGFFWNEAIETLKFVFSHYNVIGFDIVELLPNKQNHAPDYLAAKLLYKMLAFKFYNRGSK